MIVGCYSLDLYCDNPLETYFGQGATPIGFHGFDEFPHQFIAETGENCRQQARKRGWKLDLQNHKAYCPRCVLNNTKVS